MKNILTEAIYDHSKKEFKINTPCKEGMKFWIGASREVATMAVIWAQLVIEGKKYGPHAFIAPLRDPKTHQTFPGVIIGDCGPKSGMDTIDNGYILFENYRIPKEYALDKFSGVDENGKFRAKVTNPDKLFGLYMSPLSGGRAYLSLNSVMMTFNSLAIALRYICQRRQFGSGTEEQFIIDYPSMRHRIIPLVAQAYVYAFGGIKLAQMYDFNIEEILKSDSKIME